MTPPRIRIGVTGHRWPGRDAPGTVAGDVRAAIDRILELAAAAPTVVSALAEGADRLVAREVLTRPGARLEVVLPLEPDQYVGDFADDASRDEFAALLQRASTTSVVPCQRTRELTYREAGVEIVDRCDVVVAVWDGACGDMGGTSDVVGVARARGFPLLWVDTRAGGFVEEVGGVARALTAEDIRPREQGQASMIDLTRDADPESTDPTWARLEEQRQWFDRKSTGAQHLYKRMKVFELIVAAAVPVTAGLSAPAVVTATLGAIVVVCEGTQHLFQWHANYVGYRSTAEALNREKALYLADAGPYRGSNRHRLLAERIEGLLSQEHAQWTEGHTQEENATTASST